MAREAATTKEVTGSGSKRTEPGKFTPHIHPVPPISLPPISAQCFSRASLSDLCVWVKGIASYCISNQLILRYLTSVFRFFEFDVNYRHRCRCCCLRWAYLPCGVYRDMQQEQTTSCSGCQNSNADNNHYFSAPYRTARSDSSSTSSSATSATFSTRCPVTFPTSSSLPSPYCGFCSCPIKRIPTTPRVPISVATTTTLPW